MKAFKFARSAEERLFGFLVATPRPEMWKLLIVSPSQSMISEIIGGFPRFLLATLRAYFASVH